MIGVQPVQNVRTQNIFKQKQTFTPFQQQGIPRVISATNAIQTPKAVYIIPQKAAFPTVYSTLSSSVIPVNTGVTAPVMTQSVNVIKAQPSTSFSLQKIDETLQVVDLSQLEESWKKKVEDLEAELNRLRNGSFAPTSNPSVQIEERTVYIQDDSKIKELEHKISESNVQIMEHIIAISQLQMANNNMVIEMEDKNELIDEFVERKQTLDNQLIDTKNVVNDLKEELETVTYQSSEKHTVLLNEIDTWKTRLEDLHKELHEAKQDLHHTKIQLEKQKALVKDKDLI